MLVGEPYGSKTSILRVLAETLNLIALDPSSASFNEQGVVFSTINPKAITLAQLYGAFDSSTQDVIIFICVKTYLFLEKLHKKFYRIYSLKLNKMLMLFS